jgi:hypothetical protein
LSLLVGVAAGAAALLAVLLVIPRLLLQKAQNRLAAAILAREPGAWKLLTRADLSVGRYRRLPGILGLKEGSLEFTGLYGESVLIATDRIRKVTTGPRLSTGRLLFRMEALRITRAGEEEVEFVMTLPASEAWRSHLGLWAARERQADADRVTPGRR